MSHQEQNPTDDETGKPISVQNNGERRRKEFLKMCKEQNYARVMELLPRVTPEDLWDPISGNNAVDLLGIPLRDSVKEELHLTTMRALLTAKCDINHRQERKPNRDILYRICSTCRYPLSQCSDSLYYCLKRIVSLDEPEMRIQKGGGIDRNQPSDSDQTEAFLVRMLRILLDHGIDITRKLE